MSQNLLALALAVSFALPGKAGWSDRPTDPSGKKQVGGSQDDALPLQGRPVRLTRCLELNWIALGYSKVKVVSASLVKTGHYQSLFSNFSIAQTWASLRLVNQHWLCVKLQV